jgi:hypothetical protein
MTSQALLLAHLHAESSVPAPSSSDAAATLALGLGAVFAILLAMVAQGTTPAADQQDWHGNVAASASLSPSAR